MPALPSFLIQPLWHQFSALLPPQRPTHPLVGHRPRIADRVVFDKLIEVLVFGAAYWRIVGGHEKCTEMGAKSAQVSGVARSDGQTASRRSI